MLSFTKNICVLLLEFVLLCNASPGNEIPRGRILSDGELLKMIDFKIKGLEGVKKYLDSGDTLHALLELATYYKNRQKPKYFLPQDSVSEKVTKFATEYPDKVIEIENRVENFIKRYGYDVDWYTGGKDKFGRIHTPAVVRYLARQWEAQNIGLMYHFTKLGIVKKQSKPEFYLEFFLNHVKDFINDYQTGKVDTGGNDVFEKFYAGHRTHNWLSTYNLLLKDLNWRDQIFMLKVFVLHASKLFDQCKKFNYGNHQLVGAVGLYEVTLMFPEIKPFKDWNEQAFKIIIEHMNKEINNDGFQFERSSHYHLLDIINYFKVFQLNRINEITLPDGFIPKLKSMFDAIIKVSMPSKNMPVLQDVNDTIRTEETKICAEMSLGALMFNDPIYKYFACENFPAEYYWFVDDSSLKKYYSLKGTEPNIKSVSLSETGYYVMRTGWGNKDLYMIIDAGLSKYKPDHNHGNALGIIAYANGKQILPNYSVNYTDPSYKFFKNSMAKNVAIVDSILHGRRWRDNKAKTGFGIWEELPNPTACKWISGESFDYFCGEHDGYKFLGIEYQREIIFVKPNYWIVLDEFWKNKETEKIHTFKQIWQGKFDILEPQILMNKDRGVILKCTDPNVQIVRNKMFDVDFVSLEKNTEGNCQLITFIYPYTAEIPTFSIDRNNKISVKFKVDSAEIIDEIIIKTPSSNPQKNNSMIIKRKVNKKIVNIIGINALGLIDLEEPGISLNLDKEANFEMNYIQEVNKWKIRVLDSNGVIRIKDKSDKFNIPKGIWHYF